jgi:hypothetical protein
VSEVGCESGSEKCLVSGIYSGQNMPWSTNEQQLPNRSMRYFLTSLPSLPTHLNALR